MNDRRNQQLHFRVSRQELERIWSKMESSGILSIGSYLRKMALDGYCLHLDLQELRRMAYLLQMCSNNLNQYAKAANENGQVYAADLEDLRTRLDELIDIGKQILSRLAANPCKAGRTVTLPAVKYCGLHKFICMRIAFCLFCRFFPETRPAL